MPEISLLLLQNKFDIHLHKLIFNFRYLTFWLGTVFVELPHYKLCDNENRKTKYTSFPGGAEIWVLQLGRSTF